MFVTFYFTDSSGGTRDLHFGSGVLSPSVYLAASVCGYIISNIDRKVGNHGHVCITGIQPPPPRRAPPQLKVVDEPWKILHL